MTARFYCAEMSMREDAVLKNNGTANAEYQRKRATN